MGNLDPTIRLDDANEVLLEQGIVECGEMIANDGIVGELYRSAIGKSKLGQTRPRTLFIIPQCRLEFGQAPVLVRLGDSFQGVDIFPGVSLRHLALYQSGHVLRLSPSFPAQSFTKIAGEDAIEGDVAELNESESDGIAKASEDGFPGVGGHGGGGVP